MGRPIRVLIVEDSLFIQKILARILESDPDLHVVGVARNGQVAVEMARKLNPDVITMDIRMPVMDGFEATKSIMSRHPVPILVVSSSVNDEDLQISFNAIQAGALDIMEKPRGHLSGDYREMGRELIRKIKLISEIRVFRRLSGRSRSLVEEQLPPPARTGNRAVAIGASTGGPSALFALLTSFERGFPAPIFVTLHISEGFGKGCAEWIDRNSHLEVRLAEDGMAIRPGTVYFAPDDRVMRVASRHSLAVDGEKMDRRAMPIDSMLGSFAEVYGSGGIGVILTGMGDDGVRGLQQVRDGGGRTLAQDKESSVVFGMPREAADRGAAEEVISLDRIPERIISLLKA